MPNRADPRAHHGRFGQVATGEGSAGRQLTLLFGRVLTLPADCDGSFSETEVEFAAVTVDLSPAQSRWMGLHEPTRPGCPGCVLFGCCALHDEAAS